MKVMIMDKRGDWKTLAVTILTLVGIILIGAVVYRVIKGGLLG